MKSADIKIGERYKMGYSCGKVLETRVERIPGWRSTNKIRKDGVKIYVEEGYQEGKEIIVASRDIERPWEEYKQEQEERRRAMRVDGKDRERTEAKLERAVKLLEELGIEVSNSYTGWSRRANDQYHSDIEMSESNLDKLIALLTAPEIGPVEQPEETNALAELLG